MIALGNKDQYGAIHMWGMVQGAYTPAQDMRDWIFQKDGATFDTPGNVESLEKIKEWADKGYLGRGDSFNARNDAEAAAAFGKGEGALMLGGNWNASIAKDGLGDDAAFFDMPPGESGKAVAIGSASLPMHISAKSKQPDLAAAYIDFITGPTAAQALVDTQQVPAATDGTAEPGDPLGKEVQEGWDKLVEDGGLTLYPDWSSPTMLQTMGQTFQEMLAGRMSPQDVVCRTQDDWEEYHTELSEGVAVAAPSARGVGAPAPPARRERAAAAVTERRVREPRARRAAARRLPLPGARRSCSTWCSRSVRSSTRRGCRSSTGTG